MLPKPVDRELCRCAAYSQYDASPVEGRNDKFAAFITQEVRANGTIRCPEYRGQTLLTVTVKADVKSVPCCCPFARSSC